MPSWSGHHLPTVLDLLDIEAPATIRGVPQSPIHG